MRPIEKAEGNWYLRTCHFKTSTGESPFIIASPARVSLICCVDSWVKIKPKLKSQALYVLAPPPPWSRRSPVLLRPALSKASSRDKCEVRWPSHCWFNDNSEKVDKLQERCLIFA